MHRNHKLKERTWRLGIPETNFKGRRTLTARKVRRSKPVELDSSEKNMVTNLSNTIQPAKCLRL